jgi:integrase
MVAIHRGTNTDVCAVTALEKWLAVRTPGSGALCTRMRKGGRPSIIRLRPAAVSLTVKHAVNASGGKEGRFSGHSLRAGLATSAGLASIMRCGARL